MNEYYVMDEAKLSKYLKEHPEQYVEKSSNYIFKHKKQEGFCIDIVPGIYKEVRFTTLLIDLSKESQRFVKYILKNRDVRTNKVILHPEVFQVSQPYFSRVMKALLETELLVKVTYEKKLIEGKLRKAVYLVNPYFVAPFNRATAPQVYEEWDNIEKK